MKKEKNGNHFGARKPSGKLVENFYISKDENVEKIKFEHKSGDFSFRVWAGHMMNHYYDSFTKGEMASAYAVIASQIKTFVITSLQNPDFFLAYQSWFNQYFASKQKTYTDEEHTQAVGEMIEERSMNESDGTEPNGAGPESRAGDGCDNEAV